MVNDLHFYRGDDWDIIVNLTDADGNAIDISGYTFYFTLKLTTDSASNDGSALITEDVTSHTDAANGQTTISVANTDTSQVSAGKYKYDIQYKSDVSKVKTVVRGDFEVLEDTTKRTT